MGRIHPEDEPIVPKIKVKREFVDTAEDFLAYTFIGLHSAFRSTIAPILLIILFMGAGASLFMNTIFLVLFLTGSPSPLPSLTVIGVTSIIDIIIILFGVSAYNYPGRGMWYREHRVK